MCKGPRGRAKPPQKQMIIKALGQRVALGFKPSPGVLLRYVHNTREGRAIFDGGAPVEFEFVGKSGVAT